jgi:hypothetical protein
LQLAIEKKLGNKFEVGCRYKMISLGRRGPVPKENQIKAIHIEELFNIMSSRDRS